MTAGPGRTDRGHDRALSEVVGFVLMFAIIIASVGLVATFGFQQIEENRINQELRNAERVMQLVERDYDALQHGEATIRSNEVNANRGRILFTTNGTINVSVTTKSGPTFAKKYSVGSIAYEVDDTRIAYQSGMVLRDQGDSQTTITPPSIRCSPGRDAAIVSLVTLNTSVKQISGTIRIVGRTQEVDVIYPRNRTGSGGPFTPTGVDRTNVTVKTRYLQAWQRALVENGNWDNPTPATFQCSADRVYVRRTVIEVQAIS